MTIRQIFSTQMYSIFFIFIFLFQIIDAKNYFSTNPIEFVCKPCAIPSSKIIIWLPPSRPPCLHPGQPIIHWPDSNIRNQCPMNGPTSISSSQISLIEDDIILTKERICFFDGPISIKYQYECGGKTYESSMKIGHSIHSKRFENKRVKRWARRRNPNSNTIHFQQEKYVRELPEDTLIDTIVASVKASHASSQPLYYSMVAPQDSRSQNLFTLDTMSGEIRLAKSLDREVLDKHILKVTAYERTDPTISSSTTVVVHVLDVQDNSPIFEKDSYFGEIREDAPIGTTVLSVFARDLDSGDNGEVEYSLGDENGKHLLAINSKSGVIQTAAPLDRETLSLIRLDVIASDKGIPKRQTSALVEITIIDVNDNAPVFSLDSYNITILENIPIPSVIATVKATDDDFGLNGKVHYSMASSSGIGGLTIDYSTGNVTLRERIDAKNSPITIIIRAKDGAQPALSSTAPLTINVIDINDHAPTLIAAQKLITLEENVAIGEEVGRIYAIDEDSGPNGIVKYSLEGSEDFMIDEDGGIIRTTKLLDRETIAKYNLKITAHDMGTPQLNTSTLITVILKDVNDNAPIFEKEEYNVTISEELPRGSQIITLKATDKDEDQKITYKIEEADRNVFSILDIGDQGAILSISGELNQQDHKIRVEISATDQGGLQSRCYVNIFIDDVNSAPYFNDHPFSVKIPEHSPIGYPVIILKADDHDRGDNARIKYSIDSNDYFKIDETSGEISVGADLDREDRAIFTIGVTASDHAIPPLNASTQIEIILDDINDNGPQFTSSSYAATISEDIPVGTSFLQVSAIDSDIGANGIVDYFLNESASSPATHLFRLDRTSGTLRVNSKLDREQFPIIVLPIFARDRGQPPLTASSQITLTLSDVNDNSPSFEHQSYDLYIAENSPIGSTVGTIVARDPDEGQNADVSFRIFGGADAKLFDIEEDAEQNGVVRILSRAEFDYEAKSNKFFLELQASSGQLSSTVPVRIHVTDVNDNKPALKDYVILINKFDNIPIPHQIGFVPAYDPDQNATLEYFLEENDLIEVEKYTGKILVKQEWKRNIDVEFKTCVTDGANTECAQCRFIHVVIDPDWLSETTTISMSKMTVDDFWDPEVYQRLRDSLSTLNHIWKSSDIHIISVKQFSNDVIYISIAITENGQVVRGWRVIELLKESIKKLETMTLQQIEIIRDESCANEPCSHMSKCRQTQKFVGEMSFHETDNFISRTLNTVNTFVCECPNGFTSSDSRGFCDTRLDECYHGKCMNNSTCVAYENTYRCECQPGWIGKHCEISINALTCVPGFCMSDSICELERNEMKCRHCKYSKQDSNHRCQLRSVSFEGDGLININVDLPRTQWTIQFRVSTIAHNGILLFTGDRRSDFVEISIIDRVLKAQFSLGGEKADVKMENDIENRINDGEWHNVKIEFANKELIISLDDCDTHASLLLNNSPNCAARAKINLDKKCDDPTVPCYRFLDVSNGLFLGGRPGTSKQIEKTFIGCLSDLLIDNDQIDFSNIKQMHKIGNVYEGCRQKKDFCSVNSCPTSTKCVNKWNGRICSCPHVSHSTKSCANVPTLNELKGQSLFEEESFILYQPGSIGVPFEVAFDFRTSKIDMQIIAIEFTQRNIHYNLRIDDGIPQFSIGDLTMEIASPEISSKQWTNVVVKFEPDSISTIFDGIYSSKIRTKIDEMILEHMYFGVAPGTGHPSKFEGCIRNVMLDHEIIGFKKKGKTRPGCIVPNRCSAESVCPIESSCHRNWNKHKCKCHKSFIGDTCQPICSISNVCSSSGTCVSSNTTAGYECICPTNKTGKNCQFDAPKQMCPSGWWGAFPKCKKCSCSERKGYVNQCDQKTGACLCKKSHFSTINGCVRCECGVGADSTECSTEGYCKCAGDSVGRRCDRCSRFDQLLNPKTLKCEPLIGKCPSEIEYSIQWPTSVKGATVRQSCPTGESGLATRKCQQNGRWSDVNSWNCTRPEYSIMVNKFDILETPKLLNMISNATLNEATIRGKNQQIAAEALTRIVDFEQNQLIKTRAHVRDMKFTEELIETFGKVLNEHPPQEYSTMIVKLWEYSQLIFDIHQNITFLSPFFIANEHIVFSLDKLDFGNILPKFNNFIDTRPFGFSNTNIIVTGTTQIVYSLIPFPRCDRCENNLIIVVANTTQPIIVEFEIDEDDGWKYPECVHFNRKTDQWTTRGATLIGLNLTHAACEFETDGIYTMFVNDQSTSIVRIAQIDSMTSPIIAAIALFLCFVSIFLTIARRKIKNHSIRIGFILFFSLNILNLFFVHKTAINQAFCPVRNSMLSFTTIAPFSWLFLYGLYIYRMLAGAKSSPSLTTNLLIGIVFPSLIAFTTFLFTDQCSLSPNLWLFWFIILPIGLFLLLSFYAAATSILVSYHKKYDVFVAKYNVKKAVFQHFILTIFTLIMTISGLFANQLPFSFDIIETSQSLIYLIASVVIFLWSICDIGTKSSNSNGTMWLEPQKSVIIESTMADPQCSSPLITNQVELCSEWMPDIIPNDHLIQSDSPNHKLLPQRDIINHILSPADKILNDGIGHVYGNNMGSLPRLRSAQDEADDAYYTYTSSRRYKQTTTFNKD